MLYLRGNVWWTCISKNGRKYRKSLKTTNKEQALINESIIKEALVGVDIVWKDESLGESAINKWVAKVYHSSKRRAKIKGIEFSLTKKDADELFLKAGRRCQLTGMEFSFKKDERYTKRPYVPTIDRIDSKQGYTLENCRIVCLIVNISLNEWGEEIFMHMVNSCFLHHGHKIGNNKKIA